MEVAAQSIMQNVVWIWPVSLIAAGLVGGFFLEKIILRELKKIASKSQNHIPEIIMRTVNGMIILWLFITGVYWAIPSIPMGHTWIVALQRFLKIIVLWSATITVARIAEGSIRFYTEQNKGQPKKGGTIIVNVVRGLIIMLGGLFLLQTLGISITPILTALGVGGLAVALALQDTLTNLFAGVQIILTRNMRPGDYVKLDNGIEGYVSDVTWRSTMIRVPHKSMVIVPNAKLAGSIITNFHLPKKELNMEVPLAVDSHNDLKLVEKVTLEVAAQVLKDLPGAVSEFKPFLLFENFADGAVMFKVVLRGREFSDQGIIRHEFIKRLHERYTQEKITIAISNRGKGII
jgi:small-conductance mechanosensitive channel